MRHAIRTGFAVAVGLAFLAGARGDDPDPVGDAIKNANQKREHNVIKIEQKGETPEFEAIKKTEIAARIEELRGKDKTKKEEWAKKSKEEKEGEEKPMPHVVTVADPKMRTQEEADEVAKKLQQEAEEKAGKKTKKDKR